MAIQVPKPQLGQHLTIFTVRPQAVSAAGVLSDTGSAISLWGVRRGLGLQTSVEKTEINSASRTQQNEVILSQGRSMNIDIWLVNNASDPNPLETLIESYDYFKVEWTTGTVTGSIEANAFYGLRGNKSLTLEGRGEHIATLELGPVDVQWAPTAAGMGTLAQLTRTIS